MNVLVVEDTRQLADAIKKFFTLKRIDVTIRDDGESGFFEALDGGYDVIVLDIMLPVIDGETVLKELRNRDIKTPILMLTARSSLEDKLSCFENGADDYLVKPFEMRELLARVIALSRRREKDIISSLRYADLALDLEHHDLININLNRRINLSHKEFILMELFMSRSENVLNKDFLISRVWNDSESGDDNILEVYIHFLRKKLTLLESRVHIKTIKQVGYHLIEDE